MLRSVLLFAAISVCASSAVAGLLPESYDPRLNATEARCISDILDQGRCGSCYAFAASGILSDRLCRGLGFQNSPAQNKSTVSPQPLISCAKTSNGCNGGWVDRSWTYFSSSPVLTCSNVCQRGCYPYSSGVGCTDDKNQTGCAPCHTACDDGSQIDSKLRADSGRAGFIYPHDFYNQTAAIMLEVMTNGPVSTCFDIFEDFFSFFRKNPRGVYMGSKERVMAGRHCVRIIGWGSSEEIVGNATQVVPYWIVANSWGDWWGANGFFRYIRGSNLGGFEGSQVFAGCVAGSGTNCVLTFRPRAANTANSEQTSHSMHHGGSWTSTPINEAAEDVLHVATKGMREHLSTNSIQTSHVLSIKKQVVAGINYKLTYSVGSGLFELNLFRDLNGALSVGSIVRL
eukprot:TRINITY_DN8581_c0_g1_i1.p1 TRINITY_DN8581_c0_g1~~TRINITY_DN8581_c0_g1_i1.p1  ORF type:complete len:399 (+),score=46.03 TRINITY_DN8581_c0_g1_i1:199-1395(+)